MPLVYSYNSNKGRKLKNEDAVSVVKNKQGEALAIICDGVGSHSNAAYSSNYIVSTLEKDFSSMKPNVETASKLGEEIGKRLMKKNITSVVFDRNGYLYHGVVKSIADGARTAGIKF